MVIFLAGDWVVGPMRDTTRKNLGIVGKLLSTIDNDWWSGMPKKGSLERSCTAFAYGRRPPP
jgi:hypothetical protein